MVDRLASTSLSIFCSFVLSKTCVRAWSSCWNSLLYQSKIISHNGFHTFTPNSPFPGTSHHNLLTSTSNIQSYIHKSLFPQNRYQSSWPTTKAEQQKILHKTCSTRWPWREYSYTITPPSDEMCWVWSLCYADSTARGYSQNAQRQVWGYGWIGDGGWMLIGEHSTVFGQRQWKHEKIFTQQRFHG